MKAWGGRFSEAPDALAADFGRSIDIDAEMALDDLTGSIAHVHGLERAGLLTADEARAIVDGLHGLEDEVHAGTLAWDPDLEDVHMNLEMALLARIGPVAGKLHTARSRNDQVATAWGASTISRTASWASRVARSTRRPPRSSSTRRTPPWRD